LLMGAEMMAGPDGDYARSNPTGAAMQHGWAKQ
jgi:hypothetical protein